MSMERPARDEDASGNTALVTTAVLITAIWGFNVVVMKVATDRVPPLLLAALRFLFVAIPAVWVVPRPPRSCCAGWRCTASGTGARRRARPAGPLLAPRQHAARES